MRREAKDTVSDCWGSPPKVQPLLLGRGTWVHSGLLLLGRGTWLYSGLVPSYFRDYRMICEITQMHAAHELCVEYTGREVKKKLERA